MADLIRCPKCPYGKDDNIVISNVKVGQWYCTKCGGYFSKIAGVSPPAPTLSDLLKLETDDALLWSAEETKQASDQGLARFYALLNSEDRGDLKRAHIEVNGDFRPETTLEPKAIEPYDGTK